MWGACDPANPKNRRRRCAALIERVANDQYTRILIDASPDLREQLLSVPADVLHGVLFTHDHADHTHGIDDLRMVSYAMKRRIDTWADAETLASLKKRFAYCFAKPPDSGYPAILNAHTINPPDPIVIDGPAGSIEAIPIPQAHGDMTSLGFRFGNLAYSPDLSDVPETSVAFLLGLDVWVLDALRFTPHPSHFHVKRALEWVERLKPKRAILTHMTTDLDYDVLLSELPEGIQPAYDGMVIEVG
jgi:phosphoribosyl 1,2-cyclic phosphate phosphodiesterase